jgi:hypothetical protein
VSAGPISTPSRISAHSHECGSKLGSALSFVDLCEETQRRPRVAPREAASPPVSRPAWPSRRDRWWLCGERQAELPARESTSSHLQTEVLDKQLEVAIREQQRSPRSMQNVPMIISMGLRTVRVRSPSALSRLATALKLEGCWEIPTAAQPPARRPIPNR